MLNQTAIPILLLSLGLEFFSTQAFSYRPPIDIRIVHTQPLHHPTIQRRTASPLTRYVSSNGYDFEGVAAPSEADGIQRRFRPLHSVSQMTEAVVSRAPAVYRRIWSIPKNLLHKVQQPLAEAKFQAETLKIEKQSQNWILRTVVGLNLCPFALPSLKNHQVQLTIVRGTDANEIGRKVVEQLIIQKNSPSGGNSIVVAPDYFPEDFYAYMSMVQYLEEVPMKKIDLHDHVQIAPFHPHFLFDFADEKNRIDDYVNRSPYPMFHILKRHDVDHAVLTSCSGDPGKVWRRNAKLLRKLEDTMGKNGAVDFLLSSVTMEQMPEFPEEVVSKVMKEIRKDGDGPVENLVRGLWERYE